MFWSCLFVYVFFFVSRIPAKVISRLHWNPMLWSSPPIGRNRSTFGDDLVLDRESGSLFHVTYHFGTFISISHTVTSDFRETQRNVWCRQGMKVHFGSDPADTRIRINPEIIRIPNYFWLRQQKFKAWVRCTWRWRRRALSVRRVILSVVTALTHDTSVDRFSQLTDGLYCIDTYRYV